MSLDADALALFARKGLEAGHGAPQVGEANAVKVRRVLQLTADLSGGRLESLRILDLGCGEGVYAIEAGLHGAEVVAVDARSERMDEGRAVADRHGLDRVTFVQEDVRALDRDSLGGFDVVYCLGLLYHLDLDDALALLRTIRALCAGFVLLDTLVAAEAVETAARGDHVYAGIRHREHDDKDPEHVRRARVLRSIDNTFAFHFTRASLLDALRHAGFTSVLEGHAPAEPGKAADRITLAAVAGSGVSVASYPWVNELDERGIAERLSPPA